MAGEVTKQITVTSNDPQHAKETLTCKVKVLLPFRATPPYANFTMIPEHTTPIPQTITIKKGDGGPLKLELLPANQPGIEAVLREVSPGEHYELVVGLSAPQRPGRLNSAVRLKTGLQELPETTIPVYGDIPASWAGEGEAAPSAALASDPAGARQ